MPPRCSVIPAAYVARPMSLLNRPLCRLRSLPLLLALGMLLSGTATFAAEAAGRAVVVDLEPPTAVADEETSVREGIALERGRRWIEAIEHYEAVLERFPENKSIIYGLRRAKIHAGIERRYADASFENRLLTKSQTDALNLFDEISNQVRAYYVEPVTATSFTAHGTESLYLALANDKFLTRNLPQADAAAVVRFRQMLRETYWNRPCEGTGNARALVADIGRQARSQLGLAETTVAMEYVFGGCNALDDYSTYLSPDRLADLYGNIEGEFVGLGIEMKAEVGQGMLLLNVLPDSPAMTGGLQPGEFICGIDGTDCCEMSTDEAAKLLRGPSESVVALRIKTPTGDSREGRFIRRAVVIHSVEGVQMLDTTAGIGYIRMTGFQKGTADEMDAALTRLRGQGMRKLVWDLRGNPGGLLNTAVEVLDRFIDDGVLVSTKGRSFDQNWTYSAHRRGTFSELELVLVVDGNSASASEIVAGAVRDHHRGKIVGRKTYGKWSVQSIMPVRDDTGLRLTTAKFYSPHGHTYGHIGLTPDINIPLSQPYTVGYRPSDFAALLADPDVQAAVAAFGTPAVTSR